MSRKVLKKKFFEAEEDKEVEDLKYSSHYIPAWNLYEEWASQEDDDAIMMEEGIDFDKKKELIIGAKSQGLVAEEETGIDSLYESSDQCTLPPSRCPDVSPGAEALDAGVHHPIVLPGICCEGGSNNGEDEEDECMFESQSVPLIPFNVSAKLVDTKEEERHHQADINQALQMALEREHQLVRDQVS